MKIRSCRYGDSQPLSPRYFVCGYSLSTHRGQHWSGGCSSFEFGGQGIASCGHIGIAHRTLPRLQTQDLHGSSFQDSPSCLGEIGKVKPASSRLVRSFTAHCLPCRARVPGGAERQVHTRPVSSAAVGAGLLDVLYQRALGAAATRESELMLPSAFQHRTGFLRTDHRPVHARAPRALVQGEVNTRLIDPCAQHARALWRQKKPPVTCGFYHIHHMLFRGTLPSRFLRYAGRKPDALATESRTNVIEVSPRLETAVNEGGGGTTSRNAIRIFVVTTTLRADRAAEFGWELSSGGTVAAGAYGIQPCGLRDVFIRG